MNIGSKVKINVFDDGNQIYKMYDNIWIVEKRMYNGGKLLLRNLFQEEKSRQQF